MILGLRTAKYPVSTWPKASWVWPAHSASNHTFDEPFYVGFANRRLELGLVPMSAGQAACWRIGASMTFTRGDAACRWAATAVEAPTDVGGDILWRSSSIVGQHRLDLHPHFRADAVRESRPVETERLVMTRHAGR